MAIGSVINTATLTQTFDDEFNSFSASPNGATGLWQTTMANGNRTLGSNGEQEYYSDSSVGVNPFSINNGVLDIAATRGSNPLNLPYNSGAITTEGSFNQLYGYFEIDAELPAGQGLWPAFWLLPASGAWPPELDAFEVLGNDPTTLYFSTHSSVQATQGTTLTVSNVSSGFNLYGVMWGPQTVDLYINNVEVASMPTPADMNVPMYMLANLAVGGYWPGDPNSTTQFPANMLINYVHAYAYPGTTGGTVYDTLPSQNTGPAALAPVIALPAAVQATSGTATSVGGVSVAANWPGGNFTITLSDNKGLLQTAATADVFTSGEGTSSVTLTGNLAPINAALATLTYQGTTVGSENIWVSATDPQGLQSLKSVASTVVAAGAVVTPPVVTTPAPTEPVVTAPANVTLAAGTTQTLSGVSVAGGQPGVGLSVVVSDSAGLLRTTATGGVTELGEGSTALTLTGTLAAINTELASLTYQAAAATGTDWLWVSATEAGAPQATSPVVVTVTPAPAIVPPVVTTPVVTTPASVTLAAGTPDALSGISVAGGQAGVGLSVVVSDSAGLLRTTATGGVTALGEGSTSLTLTGTLAAINTELATLTYQASAAGTDWLWVSATEAGAPQATSPVVVTVTPAPVIVPPVVTAPVVTAPANVTLVAGTTQTLSGVSVAGGQAGVGLSVTVSDSAGLLHTTATSGVTALGEGSTALTLTGTLAAINTELASLTYQAAAATGTDWLWVSATEAGAPQATSPVVVTVTPAPAIVPPVVTTPVVTTPASATLAAGTTQTLSGISVADSQPGVGLSVTVSDSTGLLSATATGGVTATGEGSTSLTLTGALAAINTDLASLTYQASAAGTDWLWVSANAAGAPQVASPVVVTVTPAPVSATPMLTAATSVSLAATSSSATVTLGSAMLGLAATPTFVSGAPTGTKGYQASTAVLGVTASGGNSPQSTLQDVVAAANAEPASSIYAGGTTASSPVSVGPLVAAVGGTGSYPLGLIVPPTIDRHLTTT